MQPPQEQVVEGVLDLLQQHQEGPAAAAQGVCLQQEPELLEQLIMVQVEVEQVTRLLLVLAVKGLLFCAMPAHLPLLQQQEAQPLLLAVDTPSMCLTLTAQFLGPEEINGLLC
jgi:hypothetical protein